MTPAHAHGMSFTVFAVKKALQIERVEDPKLLVIEVYANLNILGRLEKFKTNILPRNLT